jgi:signal transduction histidine kinase
LLLSLHLLAATACAADEPLSIGQNSPSSLSLIEYLSVLEDPGGALTLADVQKPEVANRFKGGHPPAHALNFGHSTSAFWLRFRLQNTGSQAIERFLEVDEANLRSVQLHQPMGDGTYQSVVTGSVMPFATRGYPSHNFVFPLTLPAQSSQVVYLRVKTTSSFKVSVHLWDSLGFHQYKRNDYIRHAWYFGIATAMILFNLLLFVAIKDVIYLLYVVFTTCIAITFAIHNGWINEFLWIEAGFAADFLTSIGYSLSMGTLMIFMRHMLSLHKTLPRLDPLFRLVMGAHLLSPIMLALSMETFAPPLMWLKLATAVFIFGIAFHGAWQRQRAAIFFMAAFIVLFVTMLITTLTRLNLIPVNLFSQNGMLFGSAAEMLLLAFALADRFNQIRRDKARAQKEALESQRLLVENLRTSECVLEERVEQRTSELQATLRDLRATQSQLIQSEKMASLGQLVANIAHEINTPIGAVKSSGKNITDALTRTLGNLPKLFSVLDQDSRALFVRLISGHAVEAGPLSSREERRLTRETMRRLEQAGIGDAQRKAAVLVQLRAQDSLDDYLPLLAHPESELIFRIAGSVGAIIDNTGNINTAVERVSRIIFALKSFVREGGSSAPVEARLEDGIETVLSFYQSAIRLGVEVIRRYEDVPALLCHPDELIQVWTNLIHNSLQAMNHQGTLSLAVRQVGNEAVVSVGDTGCGIPEAIRDRIFDAFFSTKPVGEGSGLGLDIVKKIIDKHHGRIEVESEAGVGTTFLVYLPLHPPA